MFAARKKPTVLTWVLDQFKREPTYVGLIYKYFLFFANILFWLLSVALLAVGIYALNAEHKVVRESLDFFLNPSVWITFIGSFTFVISTLGWFGALRENHRCLTVYIWILRIIFLIQIISAIIMFIIYYVPSFRNKMNLNPKIILEKAIVKYRDNEDLEAFINGIQKKVKCCGLGTLDRESPEGYMDWNKNVYFNCSKENPSFQRCSVPASCCRHEIEMDVTKRIYTLGCIHKVGRWISTHSMIAGAIALSIIIPQIVMGYVAQALDDQIFQQKHWPPLAKELDSTTANAYMPDESQQLVRKYMRASRFERPAGTSMRNMDQLPEKPPARRSSEKRTPENPKRNSEKRPEKDIQSPKIDPESTARSSEKRRSTRKSN